MIKGDLVRLRAGSSYATMLPRPDAIGTVRSETGFRVWVVFQAPDLYADGWPAHEFERVNHLVPLADSGCSDDG